MEGQTIRWSEGKRTDAGSYFINYWTKGSIDVEAARGWTDSKKELLGEPPIEEKSGKISGSNFTANSKYQKINLLWNGGIGEGPGLQQQCINILDKNLILFKGS